MNWRRLFLLIAFLASCGRAYAQPTGSTPPNPCLNVLTCAQTRVHSKRRIYIEPVTVAGGGTVTTSDTTVNCGTTACNFTGVEPGDEIIVGTQGNKIVLTVATSACPVTGSNANCRVTIRDAGFAPDLTNSAWTYRKAALYIPNQTDTTKQAAILSPAGAFYIGQAATCAQAPCAPHAVFGVTQAAVGTVGAGAPNTGRQPLQVFRVVGGKGMSRSIDAGGAAIGGTGSVITLDSGDGGDAVGYDTGGPGGPFTLTGGGGGTLSSGNTGLGGTGGAFGMAGGPGGAVSGTASTGGTGGALTILGGAGGDAPAANTNGNGGSVTINAGLAGSGAGTAGSNGTVILGSNNTIVAVGGGTAGGFFAIVEPSASGSNVVMLSGVAMESNMIIPAVTVAAGGAVFLHATAGGL